MRRATTSSPSPQCRCVPPATVPLPIPAPKVPRFFQIVAVRWSASQCVRQGSIINLIDPGVGAQHRDLPWTAHTRTHVKCTKHATKTVPSPHTSVPRIPFCSQQLDQPHRSPPNLVKPPSSPAFKPLPMGLGAIGSAHATPVQRRAPATTGKPLVARAVASTPPGRPWLGGRRQWHSPCT